MSIARLSIQGEAPAEQLPQIADADRIEPVQRLHRPGRIPPFRPQPVELGDLGGVDRGGTAELFLRSHS